MAIGHSQPTAKRLRRRAPQAAFGARMWLPKVRHHQCALLGKWFRTAPDSEAWTFYFASLVSFLFNSFTYSQNHAQKTTSISEVTGYERDRRSLVPPVGQDSATELLDCLSSAGVDTAGIRRLPGCAPGDHVARREVKGRGIWMLVSVQWYEPGANANLLGYSSESARV